MALGDPKIEKIAVNFRELSFVASTLNSASDELTKVVAILDEALRTLNVGITAWTTFNSYASDPAEDFEYEQVGYCKINGKWGIAIQRVWGEYKRGESETEGPWLFSDAPREMRLNSVDKIPELIGALSQRASETAKKIQEKTQEVRDLASAITEITNTEKQATKAPAAPPPYARQQTPPSYPPPYVKTSIPTLADMRDPQAPPTMRDLASGKKGGK
jgi:uncharacterized phage infection (PIP) family protein YhgE